MIKSRKLSKATADLFGLPKTMTVCAPFTFFRDDRLNSFSGDVQSGSVFLLAVLTLFDIQLQIL